jgi:small GTP-binding protein
MTRTKVYRVVTIGDASVGKTSIILRLTEHRFQAEETPTIGANFTEYAEQVSGVQVNLQIWDTAGQERFRAIAPVYFRNSDAAIAVFEVDAPQTFESLKEQIVTFLSVAGDVSVILAGNKIDLADEIRISKEEVTEYAKSQGYEIFFTSAKTGEGVCEMVSSLCATLQGQISRDMPAQDVSPSVVEDHPCC